MSWSALNWFFWTNNPTLARTRAVFLVFYLYSIKLIKQKQFHDFVSEPRLNYRWSLWKSNPEPPSLCTSDPLLVRHLTNIYFGIAEHGITMQASVKM